jgi:hypothetical protein
LIALLLAFVAYGVYQQVHALVHHHRDTGFLWAAVGLLMVVYLAALWLAWRIRGKAFNRSA